MAAVDANFAVVQRSMLDRGENLDGHFDGYVNANGLATLLLALDTNVDPLVRLRVGLREIAHGEEKCNRESDGGQKTQAPD